MEYRVELRTVNQPDEVKIQDDPVRKGLSYDFRVSDGRQIYTIPDKAVVCTAKTDKLPITMDELQRFSSPNANEFTIFYTVWRYEKGYGRLLVNYILHILNTNMYVTLSPRTTMAVRCLTRHGAEKRGHNEENITCK